MKFTLTVTLDPKLSPEQRAEAIRRALSVNGAWSINDD